MHSIRVTTGINVSLLRMTAGRKTRGLIPCNAKRSAYDVLGVPQKATAKEIKSAYRKAALKLHPDVNTAPNAKEQFMEAKAAFETLIDAGKRAEYDRKMRMGFDSSTTSGSSSSGRQYGSYGGGASTNFGSRRSSAEPEDNYSFDDLLRDLDKELNDWASKKASKTGSKAPNSLWDELEMIGEEFVEFLETSAGISSDDEVGKARRSQSQEASGSSSSRGTTSSSSGNDGGTKEDRQYTDYTDKDWYRKYEGSTSSSSSFQSSTQASKPPPPKRDDDVDEMLAALKRKMGKL